MEDTKIRKGRKFDQVLDGARQVFLVDGFERANVDDIARAAGVSKATLYSYFPDKRLLFTAFATNECMRQSQEILDRIDLEGPPREVLFEGGRHFLRFVTSDLGLQMFRVCVAEGERFPDIGRAFYASGPRFMQEQLVHYFGMAMARGELSIADPGLAAFQFGELCKADIWMKRIFNVVDTVSDEEIDRLVLAAIETFMARYGT